MTLRYTFLDKVQHRAISNELMPYIQDTSIDSDETYQYSIEQSESLGLILQTIKRNGSIGIEE
jgi:hypothetical protein